MNTTVIARHLNVVESAITRCEEWAKVLFVVAKGLGARFVSKKVMGSDLTRHGLTFSARVYNGAELKNWFVIGDKRYMINEPQLKRALVDALGAGHTVNQRDVSQLLNDLTDLYGERKSTFTQQDSKTKRSYGGGNLPRGLEYDMYNENGRYFG